MSVQSDKGIPLYAAYQLFVNPRDIRWQNMEPVTGEPQFSLNPAGLHDLGFALMAEENGMLQRQTQHIGGREEIRFIVDHAAFDHYQNQTMAALGGKMPDAEQVRRLQQDMDYAFPDRRVRTANGNSYHCTAALGSIAGMLPLITANTPPNNGYTDTIAFRRAGRHGESYEPMSAEDASRLYEVFHLFGIPAQKSRDNGGISVHTSEPFFLTQYGSERLQQLYDTVYYLKYEDKAASAEEAIDALSKTLKRVPDIAGRVDAVLATHHDRLVEQWDDLMQRGQEHGEALRALAKTCTVVAPNAYEVFSGVFRDDVLGNAKSLGLTIDDLESMKPSDVIPLLQQRGGHDSIMHFFAEPETKPGTVMVKPRNLYGLSDALPMRFSDRNLTAQQFYGHLQQAAQEISTNSPTTAVVRQFNSSLAGKGIV